jgi:hypothetical protein
LAGGWQAGFDLIELLKVQNFGLTLFCGHLRLSFKEKQKAVFSLAPN